MILLVLFIWILGDRGHWLRHYINITYIALSLLDPCFAIKILRIYLKTEERIKNPNDLCQDIGVRIYNTIAHFLMNPGTNFYFGSFKIKIKSLISYNENNSNTCIYLVNVYSVIK